MIYNNGGEGNINQILHCIDSGLNFKIDGYDFKRREDFDPLTGEVTKVYVEAEGLLKFKSSSMTYIVEITSPLYASKIKPIGLGYSNNYDCYEIFVTLSQGRHFKVACFNHATTESLRYSCIKTDEMLIEIIKHIEHDLRLFIIKELLTDVNGVDDIVIDFLSNKLNVDRSKMTHAIHTAGYDYK